MDSAKPHSLGSRLLTGCAGLVALLALYVASFGPFYYLYARTGFDEPRMIPVYTPLGSLADRSPTARHWLATYANWFFDLGIRHREQAEKKSPKQP